jgi:hypothetical protein
MIMEALKISVLRKSQPVDLEVEEGAVARHFVKEMTGSQRDEYFNKTNSKVVKDGRGEVVDMKDYKGLYSTLLSFCVYGPDDKLVPESQIQQWPDTAQKALFEVARELNGLGKKDDESGEGDEKN